jgi:peptide/nickel transport system substrate-binding protein
VPAREHASCGSFCVSYMTKLAKGMFALSILVAVILLVAAGSANERVRAATVATAHRGGDVTFLSAGDVDFLDPGQTYYTFGYMVLYATNRTLYSYKPNSIRPVPDLATGPPQISKDLRTITVHIKSGIHYSPPLQHQVVRAQDIKYAFERAFTANVPNGYVFSYFSSIVGAPPAGCGSSEGTWGR